VGHRRGDKKSHARKRKAQQAKPGSESEAGASEMELGPVPAAPLPPASPASSASPESPLVGSEEDGVIVRSAGKRVCVVVPSDSEVEPAPAPTALELLNSQ
jgi:hypothetical protein